MSIGLMNLVWSTDIGPASKRLALLSLADQANEQGVTWPSVATIARRVGCSRSTAEEALKGLELDGLIRRDRRFNDSTVYTINIAALHARVTPPENRGTPEKAPSPPPIPGGPPPENPGPNHQGTKKKNLSPDADAPDASSSKPPKEPTLNQRANVLAGQYYELLGKMGNVPAFAKIIKQALVRDWPDDAVGKALAYIAENHWTLTAERLANTLRGGPKLPSRPAPGRPTGARRVGNQLIEGI